MIQEPLRDWINQLGKEFGLGVVSCMSALFVVGVLQIFNPYSPGLLRGILGLKLMFMPWLIIPLAYAYFDNAQVLGRFFKILVIFSIPINIFGLTQYVKGPTFMVATFGPGFNSNTMQAMVYGYHATFVRIIGTFASSAHYSHYLIFNVIICLALFLSGSKPRWLWVAIILQNFFCQLCTGSRGALLELGVMFIFFLAVMKRARSVMTAFLLFGGGLYLAFANLGPIVAKRFETVTEIKGVRKRTVDMAPKMFADLLAKYPLGKGMGAASQASRHLGKIQGEFSLIESYTSKLQLEMGVAGVILFYLMVVMFILQWRRWVRAFYQEDDAYLFFMALSAYAIGCLVAGAFPETPPTSVFLWASLGILPRIAAFESG